MVKDWGSYRVLRKIQYDSTKPIYLDIGCKDKKKPGYIGLDILNLGQEIVWDVTEGLPFPDGSVSGIYCSHFLEHIENKDIQDIFIEFHRISKSGAEIEIRTPHSGNTEAYFACHLSLWNEARINGIVRGLAGLCKFGIKELQKIGNELVATLIVEKDK